MACGHRNEFGICPKAGGEVNAECQQCGEYFDSLEDVFEKAEEK